MVKDWRKFIPLINIILLSILVIYIFIFFLPRYEGLEEYSSLRTMSILSIVLLSIAVFISILLYWFNIGEKEMY
ncbi:MAG TPA: hypothetical protein ENG40_03975 [Thermoprotei archaeon]|nr:hypothetical protein [Thermoprotei archaeon]